MTKMLKMASIFAFSLLLGACDKDVKNNGMGEFLPVEEAFVFSVEAIDKNTINASWKIADGYYLYKDKFEFSLANDDYQIASINIPKGKMIEDKVFGNKESYEGAVDIKITLKAVNASSVSGKATINVGYQGCSARGLCYPPQDVKSVISL